MKKLLYVGNYLRNNKTNTSYMYALGAMLQEVSYKVVFTSNKNNKVYRLLDMIRNFFKHQSDSDYVLIDTYSTQNFYYALVISQLSRLFNKKYIPILHGGNLPKRLKSNPRLSKLIFNNAYVNIAPSLYLKEAFDQAGYKAVTYIPNALNIQEYHYHKKTYESIRLLWVRSFSKIYNPKMAVLSLKLLLDKGFNASLCMVGPDGDGSLKEVKDYAKSLNVEVNFTGKLTKKAWAKLSEDYNIFINTTNIDNMPLSVIEAMALGLPVISTNVGGMRFLIHQAQDGILVSPGNAQDMVNAIEKLYTTPELAQKITLKAREKVEKFDWEVIKQHWRHILQ